MYRQPWKYYIAFGESEVLHRIDVTGSYHIVDHGITAEFMKDIMIFTKQTNITTLLASLNSVQWSGLNLHLSFDIDVVHLCQMHLYSDWYFIMATINIGVHENCMFCTAD